MEENKMNLLQLETIQAILAKIVAILAYVAPVVNAIVVFMLPFLEPMGNALANFIVVVLEMIPEGNYTWFIVITAAAGIAAIVLTFLFPGEKKENN
jgi:hypothetical protein